MLPAEFTHYRELYPVHNNYTKNDIQILNSQPGGDGIGHAICIFYEATSRKIFVYDNQPLDETQMYMLIKRYHYLSFPDSIEYVYPNPKQNDETSCAIYSIAYATSLIQAHDPRTLKLRRPQIVACSFFPQKFDYVKVFRNRILQMFNGQQLFPMIL